MIRAGSRVVIGATAAWLVGRPVLADCAQFPAVAVLHASLGARVALAAASGAGFKMVDLASEHGAGSKFLLGVLLTAAFAALHSVEPTWTVAEMLFHGVVRGKCDTKSGLLVALLVLPLLCLVPVCAPVDWPLLMCYIALGVAHNQLNKRFKWGDSLANQFRVDKLFLLVFFPSRRTLEFLGVAWVGEQAAYALVKIRARREAWYRE